MYSREAVEALADAIDTGRLESLNNLLLVHGDNPRLTAACEKRHVLLRRPGFAV